MEQQTTKSQLTPLEAAVLSFICFELEGWRTSEPGYSCIGASDIQKAFKFDNKRTVAGVLGSLAKKSFISPYEIVKGEEDIIYVQWEFIDDEFVKESNSDHASFINFKYTPETTVIKEPKSKPTKSIPTLAKTKTSHRPYELNGAHGQNFDLDGFEQGDKVKFMYKGNEEIGEYRHFHKNKHSPNGYVVIKFNGIIVERIPSKVTKVKSAKITKK